MPCLSRLPSCPYQTNFGAGVGRRGKGADSSLPLAHGRLCTPLSDWWWTQGPSCAPCSCRTLTFFLTANELASSLRSTHPVVRFAAEPLKTAHALLLPALEGHRDQWPASPPSAPLRKLSRWRRRRLPRRCGRRKPRLSSPDFRRRHFTLRPDSQPSTANGCQYPSSRPYPSSFRPRYSSAFPGSRRRCRYWKASGRASSGRCPRRRRRTRSGGTGRWPARR